MSKENKRLSISDSVSLVNYNSIENSILIGAIRDFYNFPHLLHNFSLVADNEHYIEISFYNYQKTHCTVIYQKKLKPNKINKRYRRC